jgi:hypothetical protein
MMQARREEGMDQTRILCEIKKRVEKMFLFFIFINYIIFLFYRIRIPISDLEIEDIYLD